MELIHAVSYHLGLLDHPLFPLPIYHPVQPSKGKSIHQVIPL